MQNKQEEQQNNKVEIQGGDPSPPLFYVKTRRNFSLYIFLSV